MTSTDKTVLVPLREVSVDFYGDTLIAVHIEANDESVIYVLLRPICQHLGLSWSGQRERTLRDSVLREVIRFVRVESRNVGGDQVMLSLPLEYLPGWLFGIAVSRVHPRLHESLYRYRKDCFRVLAAHFPHTFAHALFDVTDVSLTAGVPGMVYVASGGGYYKIGTSKNVEKRMQSLNAALPFPVKLIHAIHTDDARLLERRLHQLYRAAGKYINGEWFNLSDADVEALRSIESAFLATDIDKHLSILASVSKRKELIHG